MIRHPFYDLSSRAERGIGSLPATAVPLVEVAQRQFTLLAVAFFPVTNVLLESGQQIKSYVGGLKILALRLRDVMDKRTERRRSRWRRRLAAGCKRSCIHSRHQAGRNRFDIAFDSADLAREQYMGMRFHLYRRVQQRR